MAKKEEPFHAPFQKLKGVKIKDKAQAPVKKPPVKPREPELNGGEIFSLAMEGVVPMSDSLTITPEPADPREVVSAMKENLSRQNDGVIDELRALVRGKATFDITSTGEYLEGHAIPVDPNTMTKLKAGEFTIQAFLDLHGMTRPAAETALVSFLLNSHALGHRTVLVIHGRGLKSSQGPVLKEQLVRWLSTGSLSHLILAFCSARPCDGGTGALYVLLKRRPKKSKWKRPL